MPIKYEYDPSLNIVHTQLYGELSTLEVSNHFSKIVNDDDIGNSFVEIVRLDKVEDFLFSLKGAERIIKLYKQLVNLAVRYNVEKSNVRVILNEVEMENWGIRGGQAASEVTLGFKTDI